MNSLYWSGKGLSALHRFYRTNFVVYVEGEDDILFWQHRISIICQHDKFTVLSVAPQNKKTGGKKELDKKMDNIINDDAQIIVASDADYSDILKNKKKHSRIIYSFGYSIENTMYCPVVLNRIARTRIRDYTFDETFKIRNWLEEFYNDLEELLIIDIANEYFGKGKGVLGDKSEPFLSGNGSSFKLDSRKITKETIALKSDFSEEELKHIRFLLKKYRKKPWFIIRGHFLTGGVRNLLKSIFKRNNADTCFSNENLYEGSVEQCQRCRCTDFRYLENRIAKAVNALSM